MRVITVRQPWAWAIIHGGKDVENRSRNIAGKYRGPVAIHAGLSVDLDALTTPLIVGAVAIKRLTTALGHPSTFRESPRGAIIGVVDLVDVHYDRGQESELCSPWAETELHHLTFANPRPVTPIPAKGKLGLWRPDDALAAQIEAGGE